MWHLTKILAAWQLWFSDGKPIDTIRGGHGVSSRLIIEKQGFLDFTEVRSAESIAVDANGATLWLRKHATTASYQVCPSLQNSTYPLNLSLEIKEDGGFRLSLLQIPDIISACYSISTDVSGRLKPLPEIRSDDVKFIDKMIKEKYVPYQNIPDAPLKSVEEIKALGRRFFPFTPYNFELAMCVYDWTTGSFARIVLFKIFQYTGLNSGNPSLPHPLNQDSLTNEIWKSNFSVYTPQNVDYMRPFFMTPADSLANLTDQLNKVVDQVYNFSEIQNRLLSAAMRSLPRTSLISKPQLFSGQVDIQQLGIEHFGIEFEECPLNKGPVGVELVQPFSSAISSFLSVGKTVSTKMVWSFTDNLSDAMHYSNGIVLVASLPADAWVWDEVAFITPLSDDPAKIEYTFAPGTQFQIQSIENTTTEGKPVTVISLQPKLRRAQSLAARGIFDQIRPAKLASADIRRFVEAFKAPADPPHSQSRTAGRSCACVRQ